MPSVASSSSSTAIRTIGGTVSGVRALARLTMRI
jgi:hypothetical protein